MSVDTYFCFCCLSTEGLCGLFGSKTEINYADLLKDLYCIEASCQDYEDDSYICVECADKLRDSVKFKNQMLETLNILQGNGLIKMIKSTLGGLSVHKVLDDDIYLQDDKKMSTSKDGDVFNTDEIEEKYETKNQTTSLHKQHSKAAMKKQYPEISLKNEKKFTVTRKTGPRFPRPLKVPEPTYTVTGDLICKLCGEEQPNTRVFHRHMNRHFPNHICDTCGKGYLTEKRLKRHMSSHDTGSFTCKACGCVFTNYNTYNSHKQRKHSTVPVYKCPSCPMRFATLTRRARHLAGTHGQQMEKYACGVCGQKFVVSGNLSSHMRNTHLKVKRHKCLDCGAGFFHKQELRAHRATHDGLKGFQCHVCAKSYPRKNSLVVHMRTHTGDKPFKCDKCQQSFTQKCSLTKHSKRHNRASKDGEEKNENSSPRQGNTVENSVASVVSNM